ncbi:nitroreductase/quinone reductase family protein [Streptomyces candidus]|uniref:Deazaflavin-dependent oxidoreductase (Nitroreductase family) n=1 Tax=Streptomyces candidus TaxID=67283 RepID=A0A7X0HCE0_9ACTN|nr:nitroreductase/quinone reductase family protein [Streptomyces candidus]MBB6435055.1 deazaflavin-dependent oxidoreductase (nitroreductase family) [Streptomyces candidus]GHH40925.1 cation-binding protein [Streptomyces candidus]
MSSAASESPSAFASVTSETGPASFNQWVIDEFRANGGTVGGPFEGADLLLLTTTGAKSGTPHTVPLGHVTDTDGRLLIVASHLGSPRHPAWYHNVLAHPAVQVEVGRRSYDAVAVPAEGEHRDRLFERVVSAEPGYAEYQAQTTRTLPVVVLEPTAYGPPAPGGGPRPVLTVGDKLLEIHLWLRGQLQRVQADAEAHFAAARTAPGAPTLPGLGLQIRQHCLAFCETLDFHHRSEDAAVLPQIELHHPHLAEAIGRLREEHRKVAALKSRLVAHLDAFTTADPAVFLAELSVIADELTAHMDYEESVVLPVLSEIPLPSGPPPTAA